MVPKDASGHFARFFLGCGVEIINLNLAIQTQPGHELKMPLGAFSTSQLSVRGPVSQGPVGFLDFCLLASLGICLCFCKSDLKLATQHRDLSGPQGPQSLKRAPSELRPWPFPTGCSL